MKRFAKTKVFALLLLFAGLAAALSFAQSPDPKAEAALLQPGAYYWTGRDWQPMEPLTWSANGLKKNGKSYVWTYRGSEARVQVKIASPLFCYKLPEAGTGKPAPSALESLVIARLGQKKDHREFETVSGTSAFAFQATSNKERSREITVRSVTPDVFLIAPNEPLSPGEYVLGGSSLAISGYDFGIHPVR
jgi:hypothetical protein